ncbi:putative nicolin-1-like [Apostichopus japonicus]|uniref:Putative nicolin-1-like n=1 Tax=Stichopus japonicus TaxID=307972 RepID=A0A2G8KHI9_STIJA|nr:putative nicolin-1-like [Apostichopus japonicus]
MLPQKFSLRRENQLLASSVGKPCELNLDLNKQNQVDSSQSGSKRTSGILVLEVLPADTPCDIGSISFKNFYTAFLTIKVKTVPEENGQDVKEEGKWSTCLHQHQLMPNPHCETGSQDYFTISSKQMLFQPKRVCLVRLIMQQPSPVWISFKVENISLMSDKLVEDKNNSVILKWLEEQTEYGTDEPPSEEKTDATAKEGRRTHAEVMGINRNCPSAPANPIISWKVDGSYEINLLSYT